MENLKLDDGVVVEESIREAVKRVSTPIFEKVLKEASNNPVWVGTKGSSNKGVSFYQPHNFRRWFLFSKVNFCWDFYKKPTLTHMGIVHGLLNHGSEHYFDNFMDCSIRVKKNQIEITNKNPSWVTVVHGVSDDCSKVIADRELECIEVLKNFIELAGGSSDFVVLNRDSEDKIQGNKITESLPLDMRFRIPIVKKEYNEKVIEYHGKDSPVHVAKFFENMAVIDKADEIMSSIESTNPLRVLKQRLGSPLEWNVGYQHDKFRVLFENKDLVMLLSAKEMKEFEEWFWGVKGDKQTLLWSKDGGGVFNE